MNLQAPFVRLGTLATEWGVSTRTVKRILEREEIAPCSWGKYRTADIMRFQKENGQPELTRNDHIEVIKLKSELRALKEENARLKEILRVIRREVEEK